MPKRNSPRHEHTSTERKRILIAQSAARLIAEGLNDFTAAKQKAAFQLGISAKASLPEDAEVRKALKSHLTLFGSPNDKAAVQDLRDLALVAMAQFESFSPWICGELLEETATIHSEIELLFFEVEPKLFEIYLNNNGIAHEPGPGSRAGAQTAVTFLIPYRGTQIICTLHPERPAPTRSAVKGVAPPQRLQLRMAKQLFERLASGESGLIQDS